MRNHAMNRTTELRGLLGLLLLVMAMFSSGCGTVTSNDTVSSSAVPTIVERTPTAAPTKTVSPIATVTRQPQSLTTAAPTVIKSKQLLFTQVQSVAAP